MSASLSKDHRVACRRVDLSDGFVCGASSRRRPPLWAARRNGGDAWKHTTVHAGGQRELGFVAARYDAQAAIARALWCQEELDDHHARVKAPGVPERRLGERRSVAATAVKRAACVAGLHHYSHRLHVEAVPRAEYLIQPRGDRLVVQQLPERARGRQEIRQLRQQTG
jgi:hypothetical protein